MFSYREAKQRCMLYGWKLSYRDGYYHLESRTCSFKTNDLDDAVWYAIRDV